MKKFHKLSKPKFSQVKNFHGQGNMYKCGNSMQKTIERYQRHAKDGQINNKVIEQNIQNNWVHLQPLKYEATNMAKKIELLEASNRKLMGEDLGSCSIDELEQLESKLEGSLNNIKERKAQLFKEQIEQLKQKERTLAEEKAILSEKIEVQAQQLAILEREIVPYCQGSPNDVETELFIGMPKRGSRRHPSQK